MEKIIVYIIRYEKEDLSIGLLVTNDGNYNLDGKRILSVTTEQVNEIVWGI